MSNQPNNVSPSKGNDDEYYDSREEQEEDVLWHFRTVFQKSHGDLLDSYNLTEDEEDFLDGLYTDPTLYCTVAGITTFVVSRGTRRGIRNLVARRNQRRQQQQQQQFYGGGGGGGGGMNNNNPYQPYQTPPPHNYQQFPPHQYGSSTPMYAQQPLQHQQQQHWARRLFTFGNLFDFTTASIVGILVGTYMIDMKESESELERIPLMEGQSNIAVAFCPVLQQEYQRQLRLANQYGSSSGTAHDDDDHGESSSNNNNNTITAEYNLGLFTVQIQEEEGFSGGAAAADQHKEILKNPQNPNLQSYINFIKNCKRRQKVQQRLSMLQQQQGGSAGFGMMMTTTMNPFLNNNNNNNHPSNIAIPPPGVEAYEIEEDEDEEEENDDGDDDDDNNNWTSDQQVSSWVSDQEDDH